MTKSADRYFGCAPWQVTEEGYDPAHGRVSESIFALANERFGVRGYFEEGGSVPTLRGSYLGGVYELEDAEGPGGYKGIVKQSHYMVTGADPLDTALSVEGETLDLGVCTFSDFRRALDMRDGRLSRDFIWHSPAGRIRCAFERLVGMEDAQWLLQRMTLTALDGDAQAEVALAVNGNIPRQANQRCLWRELDNSFQAGVSCLVLETGTTDQRVRYAMRAQGPGALEAQRGPRLAGVGGPVRLPKGEPMVWERAVSIAVAREPEEALTGMPRDWPAFDALLTANRSHWAAFWAASDVEILGDPENQQGIRYCLFQLHQTYRGLDPRDNIGAKGLTGEAYNGHAFWDTETYCLPYYLLHDAHAARRLLIYRYRTLPQALQRAKELDLRGACYPVATLNGKEACTLWQHASLQMQPSTAVAYGIQTYVHQTGDLAFLHREGIEMLVQICRYLASRGDWNQEGSAYGYYGVMGPDEFHMMVHHNFYTNYMGQRTLRFTLETLEALDETARDRLRARTDLRPEELQAWRACADRMILLRGPEGLIEQHEGYFGLPHLDIAAIPQEDFPLYEHWSYDRLYRTDMIKQPDVLMAMLLHPSDFTLAEKTVNYDYYAPRCIHESSLSPSVHAILASELGRGEEAFGFFAYATRLDLDNYNRNTRDGLHTTGIAAAWMTLTMGFGGLRVDGPLPALAPTLPAGWQGYSFSLLLGGSRVKVTVSPDQTRLELLEGEAVTVLLYGERVRVSGQ